MLPRILVYNIFAKEKNNRATENFKFVLQMARGEYFMWAAHDDRWHPDFIYLGVRVLDDDPSCGLVFCEFETKNLVTGTSTRSYVGMYNSDNHIEIGLCVIYRRVPILFMGCKEGPSWNCWR
jgi:cellulose synthase/poly-beta-1,6-N-acetylglucosamine synthase-like glycosyltransferase